MFFTSSVSFHLFLIPYTLSLSLPLFLLLAQVRAEDQKILRLGRNSCAVRSVSLALVGSKAGVLKSAEDGAKPFGAGLAPPSSSARGHTGTPGSVYLQVESDCLGRP